MIRQAVMVLTASLLLAGTAFAAMPQTSGAASGARASSLQHQVAQVHKAVKSQKQKTDQLRQQVDRLQKQSQVDQQHIKQNDRTIARLHQQLKQLGSDPGQSGAH